MLSVRSYSVFQQTIAAVVLLLHQHHHHHLLTVITAFLVDNFPRQPIFSYAPSPVCRMQDTFKETVSSMRKCKVFWSLRRKPLPLLNKQELPFSLVIQPPVLPLYLSVLARSGRCLTGIRKRILATITAFISLLPFFISAAGGRERPTKQGRTMNEHVFCASFSLMKLQIDCKIILLW